MTICLQTLGVDHVTAIRGTFQPAHRARGSARLRGQARDAHLAAEHRNAAPDQRREEAQGHALRMKTNAPKTHNGSVHSAPVQLYS